jgi:two-component system nitrogen regulation sensor histidine kinase NtrY
VGEIGRMVDEFSDFARMPAPVFREEDVGEIIRQAIFLQRQSSPKIAFDVQLPEGKTLLFCDGRQVSRALTNLLKNAAESIEGRELPNPPPGRIAVRVAAGPHETAISIEDNGKGLPKEERHRLTEPYVTTRAKGTGLGLAIVKKIMEDHGGDLVLEDGEEAGARVSLVFRRSDILEPSSPQSDTDTANSPLAASI